MKALESHSNPVASRRGSVLCGTDFSKNAKHAADAAAAIATALKQNLVLVHVVERTADDFGKRVKWKRFLASVQEQLHAEAARLEAQGVSVERALVRFARAGSALVKIAEERAVALIVVSSVSKTAWDRWTMGSESELVAQTAQAPTLVVRDADRVASWARGKRSLKVFVAADFSMSAEAALQWVRQLQKIGPCEVTIGHVYSPPDERDRLGLPIPATFQVHDPAAQKTLERDLVRKAANVLGENAARVLVRATWGMPDAPLLEMAEAEKADLVVVGTHQRHGLSRLWNISVSRGLLHHARMSVAVVPTPTALRHGVGPVPHVSRVLVATDLTELGDRAVAAAYGVMPLGGVVRIIHVMPPWGLPGPLLTHYQPKRLTKKDHNRLASECVKKLRKLVPPESEIRGITTEVAVVQHRNTAQAIREEAEWFGADLVCLASHGRSRVAKVMRSSVVEKVKTLSRRPLLVVQAGQT